MPAPSAIDKGMPILIVDDFSTMRRIVRKCLRELGFENIGEAADGEVALEYLKSNRVALIVSDWNMPNMMGLDLLRAIRANQSLKEIPFLMVTAECQKANVIDAARAGASDYIVKPFTAQMLRSKLELMFSGKID